MYIRVTKAEYVKDYKVRLSFNDGASGVADLQDVVEYGGVFALLRDPDYFRNFTLNEVADTISWPNGADVAPESLRARLQ
jgi:hypothetical protein